MNGREPQWRINTELIKSCISSKTLFFSFFSSLFFSCFLIKKTMEIRQNPFDTFTILTNVTFRRRRLFAEPGPNWLALIGQSKLLAWEERTSSRLSSHYTKLIMHYLCSPEAELEVGGYIVVWDTLKLQIKHRIVRKP